MLKVHEIETERLILRTPRPNDAASIAEWISDPELYEMWAAKPLDLELFPLEYFGTEEKIKETTDWGNNLDWFIYHKADGKMIGEVEIYDIVDEYQGELSYRLSKSYRGKGYAAEAVEAAVRTAFETTVIMRLSAHIDVRNNSSVKLIEKLGFSYEGTHRQEKFFDTVSDWRVYSFLRSDLEKLRK
jgi:ribosomal-protein-alanine N-acetyltransferase